MRLKSLVLGILSFLFVLPVGVVHAQGTFDCRWVLIPGGPAHCSASNDHCDADHEPDYVTCGGYKDQTSCNAATGLTCVNTGTGTTPYEMQSPDIENCNGGQGFMTAIGCIPVETPQGFIEFVLKWAMGIGGGIALALIGFAGFQIITSMGDPKKLQSGKDLLTAAIAGLLFLLFGAFALNLIGVQILRIPGFGS